MPFLKKKIYRIINHFTNSSILSTFGSSIYNTPREISSIKPEIDNDLAWSHSHKNPTLESWKINWSLSITKKLKKNYNKVEKGLIITI